MALTALLGNKPTPTRIGDLVLDALLQESHNLQNRVTEFPIEKGANIADHITNDPREVTVEGFITNSPVKLVGGLLARLGRGQVSAQDQATGPGLNYAQIAFEELERLYRKRDLVTIVGAYKTYTGMALVSLSIPRDPGTGSALRFTAVFREVQTVESRTVAVKTKTTRSGKSQPRRDTGKQVASSTKDGSKKYVSAIRSFQRRNLSSLTGGQ